MTKAVTKAQVQKSNQKRFLGFWMLTIVVIFSALQINNANADSFNTNHVLVGKIWSVDQNKFIDEESLKEHAVSSKYVVVGETHDNDQHHIAQAKVLTWLLNDNKIVSPVFEMLSSDQLKEIDGKTLKSSDNFFDKVSWDQSGWPDRKLYKPIFDIVIKNDLPIYGAETERKLLMQLMKGGPDKLPTDISSYLKTVKLDENAKEQFKEEIIASHCGMLPEKMVKPMILGQRVRDAVMAKTVIEAGSNSQPILIAGSGHARKDVGVPAYIKAQNPEANILSIALMEVVEDVTIPSEYAGAWLSEEIPFDYVWFTQRIEREDPCKELKQHFKKHPI